MSRTNGNSESVPRSPKRGRRPGPTRCVVQMRVRGSGKVWNYYSVTIHAAPHQVMKQLQEVAAFFKHEKGEN